MEAALRDAARAYGWTQELARLVSAYVARAHDEPSDDGQLPADALGAVSVSPVVAAASVDGTRVDADDATNVADAAVATAATDASAPRATTAPSTAPRSIGRGRRVLLSESESEPESDGGDDDDDDDEVQIRRRTTAVESTMTNAKTPAPASSARRMQRIVLLSGSESDDDEVRVRRRQPTSAVATASARRLQRAAPATNAPQSPLRSARRDAVLRQFLDMSASDGDDAGSDSMDDGDDDDDDDADDSFIVGDDVEEYESSASESSDGTLPRQPAAAAPKTVVNLVDSSSSSSSSSSDDDDGDSRHTRRKVGSSDDADVRALTNRMRTVRIATSGDEDAAMPDDDAESPSVVRPSRKARTMPPQTPLTPGQFVRRREKLAKDVYAEYNRVAFDNRLPADLPVVWSTTKQRTAGSCVYFTRNGERGVRRIELAVRVCDNEGKLRSTLLHEMCHAAAFLFDGHGKHGRPFRAWGARACARLPGMTVERCHNYTINTKYNYVCNDCGVCIGRQSKSIDVARKVCGRCGGALTLFGRRGADGLPMSLDDGRSPAPNRYAAFVKEHYAATKRAMPGASGADVMRAVAQRFRELSGTADKENAAAAAAAAVVLVTPRVRALVVCSDDEGGAA